MLHKFPITSIYNNLINLRIKLIVKNLSTNSFVKLKEPNLRRIAIWKQAWAKNLEIVEMQSRLGVVLFFLTKSTNCAIKNTCVVYFDQRTHSSSIMYFKYLHFQVFLIIFDHVNACPSMHSLVEKHNIPANLQLGKLRQSNSRLNWVFLTT